MDFCAWCVPVAQSIKINREERTKTIHKPNGNRSNLQPWYASETNKREEDHGNLTEPIFEWWGTIFPPRGDSLTVKHRVCLPNAPWPFSREVAETLQTERGPERGPTPPGPAGGAGSISQTCSAWPLASFHASLLFQCKSEARHVLHLRYWVNMEIKPALVSCGHERKQQGSKHQGILLPHQHRPHRLQVG